MKSTPLVSVLINNYNYAAFLKCAINSALTQTYKNLEVIVVDDGSADSSREILESYAGQIRTILKPNGGQASAFNVGIQACRGEWICMLDSDDYWLQNKVDWVVQTANAHPKANLIYHRVQNVDRDGVPLGIPWPKRVYGGDLAPVVQRSGGWWPYPPTTALSFRRSFLKSIPEVPEIDFRTCADAYLADLAPFLGEVIGIPKVLSDYRQHSNNLYSGRSERMVIERYLLRHGALNRALETLGSTTRVSLEDHFPYQYARYRLGEGDRYKMSVVALKFPWNSVIQKSRGLAGLWLRARPTTPLQEARP
ncbi:MAG: glycosyltransferase [Anaerolineae bacterium]|nr:glycosyltransferase [Gloeobacterales cyanobacterium ES-bin-313]